MTATGTHSPRHEPAHTSGRDKERDLRLQDLTEADLDLVWHTEKRAYAHPWSRGNFADSLRAGHPARLLVTPVQAGDAPLQLTASGHLLLGYWVAMAGVDEMHLLNIAVAPEHRRQGWGLVLLQTLATHCMAVGLSWLWLEARVHNTPALGLYRRMGFEAVGLRKQYYPASNGQREDAVVMSLNLHTGVHPQRLQVGGVLPCPCVAPSHPCRDAPSVKTSA
jgi:[ribosomal protein S18]-alanine N-acetyltransferase